MPYPLILDGKIIEIADAMFEVNAALSWGPPSDTAQVGDSFDGTSYSRLDGLIVPAPTLADRRAALAVERYAKQSGGVMFNAAGAVAPSPVASDAASTGMITASYVAAMGGHWVNGTPWKMADGTFVPLTAADMQAMALKVLGFISACFAREAELSAALATDLITDITAGWPANT